MLICFWSFRIWMWMLGTHFSRGLETMLCLVGWGGRIGRLRRRRRTLLLRYGVEDEVMRFMKRDMGCYLNSAPAALNDVAAYPDSMWVHVQLQKRIMMFAPF
jgi:hypothetical protein